MIKLPDWENFDPFMARLKFEAHASHLRYRLTVNRETQKMLFSSAHAFANGTLDFLRNNPHRLRPLALAQDEIQLFYFLTEAARGGELKLIRVEGNFDSRGRPLLTLAYKAHYEVLYGPTVSDMFAEMAAEKTARLSSILGPGMRVPTIFVSGSMGRNPYRSFDFKSLPGKPTNIKELQKMLGLESQPKPGGTRILGLNRDGNSYQTIQVAWNESDQPISSKWHYLGAFAGSDTQIFHHLYARKNDNDKLVRRARLSQSEAEPTARRQLRLKTRDNITSWLIPGQLIRTK